MGGNARNAIAIEVVPRVSAGATPEDTVEGQVVEMAARDLQAQLEAVSRPVIDAMKTVQPDSCTLEFSLGIKGTAKIPIIVSAESNAAFKVSITWKREVPR